MKQKIQVTLELDVEPYTREELLEQGFDEDDAAPEPVSEGEARDIGDGVASLLQSEEYAEEAIAGSACFVHIRGARLISASVAEEKQVAAPILLSSKTERE